TMKWNEGHDYGLTIIPVSKGGYISSSAWDVADLKALVIRHNIYGDTIWTSKPLAPNRAWIWDIIETYDSNYVMVGYYDTTLVDQVFIMKMNDVGNILWKTDIDFLSDATHSMNIIETSDSGLFWTGSFGSNPSPNLRMVVGKLNPMGDTIWTRLYGDSTITMLGVASIELPDKAILSIGPGSVAGSCLTVLKSEENGDSMWIRHPICNGNKYFLPQSIIIDRDGNLLVTGSATDTTTNIVCALLTKMDTSGTIIWDKEFGCSVSSDFESISLTDDGGYILSGRHSGQIYLVKLDSLYNSYSNNISGSVFLDQNNDCIHDINLGEAGLPNRIVKVDPGPWYAYADANGKYELDIDTGSYSVSQILPNNLWTIGQNCSVPYNITFGAPYDTSAGNDFGNEISIYAPLMNVNIGTALLRPCRRNTYQVSYCNDGTSPAVGAKVVIDFAPRIIPLSSSIPWTQVGNEYTFQLGTVNPGQCGSFTITDSVSCNAVLGQTLCVEAHIFPDSIPEPINTGWDHSSIEVSGSCQGNLIVFNISNTGDPGTGDMTAPSEYRIYRDDSLMTTQSFQLNGGSSFGVTQTADGHTYRLEADQRPGHPGNSQPRVTIENCGNPAVFGHVLTVAQDDDDDFIDIDCQVVLNSYDPNEKLHEPVG
ncbi:MAG: hypothetical protein IH946_03855, partial [Bacteroidetes bacterium]|nr:hypothetical protein [Bacteroidota bacterium]